MRSILNKILATCILILFYSCEKDIAVIEFNDVNYSPTFLTFPKPITFPEPNIPENNPITKEGIILGEKLFHETLLSGDNTISCSSCHSEKYSFSEPSRFSTGFNDKIGFRNAMSITNLAWRNKLNWDGSSKSLEEQVFEPVTNPIEMNSKSWSDVIEKLKNDKEYPILFWQAFGVIDFDSTHVSKAIAQFERIIVSGNAKIDQFEKNEISLSLSEFRGMQIYRSERGDCFHCHPYPALTDNDFHNNGLDPEPYSDDGRFLISGEVLDKGKFVTPTLRNIEFTAPYMHDGRFQTLEEVIEHYNFGGHPSETVDPLMKHIGKGLMLSSQDKEDLINFLKTFSDTNIVYLQQYTE